MGDARFGTSEEGFSVRNAGWIKGVRDWDPAVVMLDIPRLKVADHVVTYNALMVMIHAIGGNQACVNSQTNFP